MKKTVTFIVVAIGLLTGCVGPRLTFTGPYLGYDESRSFDVDQDRAFAEGRPKALMKYWTMSEVRTADDRALSSPKERRLFPAKKNGYIYFSLAYSYEYYVWDSSPEDPNLLTTTGNYWVEKLDRFKMPATR